MSPVRREERWHAVLAHRERLLRLSRARLGNPHDAEDCVQEAMLRCVEFPDLDEERLGPFLTSVTLRLCADVHRGRARGDRLTYKLSYSMVEPSPEDSICDRAESVWLSRRLDSLPSRQREIVEARAEGLSCGAVAEQMRMSYSAIESALARVRRSLRTALESTLGLAALRPRRFAVGAIAAGASAITAAGLVTTPPAGAPRESTAAPPITVRRVAVRPTLVARTRPVRPAAAGEIARPTRTAAAAARTVDRPDPYRPVLKASAGNTRADVSQSEEPIVDALSRCVRYGVRLDGYVVTCQHSDDARSQS